jgi:hypothetical protein
MEELTHARSDDQVFIFFGIITNLLFVGPDNYPDHQQTTVYK